jgi:hypothetical protein
VSPWQNAKASHTVDNVNSLPFIAVNSDDEIISLVMAPQLKTFFGLIDSFSASKNTIQEIINSDPQRFIDLQKLDLINKAVRIIKQSVEKARIQNFLELIFGMKRRLGSS